MACFLLKTSSNVLCFCWQLFLYSLKYGFLLVEIYLTIRKTKLSLSVLFTSRAIPVMISEPCNTRDQILSSGVQIWALTFPVLSSAYITYFIAKILSIFILPPSFSFNVRAVMIHPRLHICLWCLSGAIHNVVMPGYLMLMLLGSHLLCMRQCQVLNSWSHVCRVEALLLSHIKFLKTL